METEVKIKIKKLIEEIGETVVKERFTQQDVRILKQMFLDKLGHYESASKALLMDDIIERMKEIDSSIKYFPYGFLCVNGLGTTYYRDFVCLRGVLNNIGGEYDIEGVSKDEKQFIMESFSKIKNDSKLFNLVRELHSISYKNTDENYVWDYTTEPFEDGTYILYYCGDSKTLGWVKLKV